MCAIEILKTRKLLQVGALLALTAALGLAALIVACGFCQTNAYADERSKTYAAIDTSHAFDSASSMESSDETNGQYYLVLTDVFGFKHYMPIGDNPKSPLVIGADCELDTHVPIETVYLDSPPIEDRMPLCPTNLDRIRGSNRYATSVKLSSSAFESADTVVLVSGESFADSVTATSLAGALSAPILTINPKELLTTELKDEIKRLGATHAIIVGGPRALPDWMTSSIKRITGSVERIAGDTRYDTAIKIARRLGSAASDTAIIATGANFADAASIGSYAYASKSPVFLARPDGTLDEATVDAICDGGYSKVVILGGTSAVSDNVKKQISSRTTCKFLRIAGSNRYVTSAKIARWALGLEKKAAVQPEVVLQPTHVYVATGKKFPDALSASAAAGSRNAVVLLAADSEAGRYAVSSVVKPLCAKIDNLHFIGDTPALPSCVARDFVLAAEGSLL